MTPQRYARSWDRALEWWCYRCWDPQQRGGDIPLLTLIAVWLGCMFISFAYMGGPLLLALLLVLL